MGQAFPLIALALTAAGTGSQIAASNQAKRATNKTVENELLRQKGYQQSANAEFLKNLAASNAADDVGRAVMGSKTYNDLYDRLTQTSPIANSEPVMDVTEDKKVGQSVEKYRKDTGQSFGGVYGYVNQRSLDNQIRNLRANQELARIGQFSRGSENAYRAELQDAMHAGDTLANIGRGLSAAGAVAGSAAPMFAAPATSASAAGSAAASTTANTITAADLATLMGPASSLFALPSTSMWNYPSLTVNNTGAMFQQLKDQPRYQKYY